jgi:hypothetical protein
MALENAEREVNKIMSKIDSNNSGFIDYSGKTLSYFIFGKEFVMATIDKKTLITIEKLNIVFSMIDRDNSGYITVKELKTIFGGGKYSEDSWKDVMR